MGTRVPRRVRLVERERDLDGRPGGRACTPLHAPELAASARQDDHRLRLRVRGERARGGVGYEPLCGGALRIGVADRESHLYPTCGGRTGRSAARGSRPSADAARHHVGRYPDHHDREEQDEELSHADPREPILVRAGPAIKRM